MNFMRSLKQQGFTLAEIMVTIAVLGVLSMIVINQSQLLGSSKRDANERAIINAIYDKLSIELARQQTCAASPSTNFYGKLINNPDVTFPITDSTGTTIITKGGVYGVQSGAVVTANAASSQNGVTVNLIKTYPGATTSEMTLEVRFGKKTDFTGALSTLFRGEQRIYLKLNVIPDPLSPTLVKYCFNDATSSVTAAIRSTCVGNGGTFEEPTVTPPYGRCVYEDTAQTCPAGKYISKVQMTNGKIVTTCSALTSTCSTAGQVVYSYNTNGTPNCDWPLPKCGPGKIIVKSSSGPYVCSNTDTGCSGLYAIQSFNTDGTVQCQPYYSYMTCGSGYVTAVGPGTISCSSGAVNPVTCGAGQFISGTNSNNQPVCSNYINLGATCPAGQAATGFDSNGNIVCAVMERRLSCNGSYSPGNLKFSACTSAGGVVQNRDGGTNSFCRLTGSSCATFGMTACLTWGNSGGVSSTTSCTDTDSACSYSIQTRSIQGWNVWQNPVSSSQRTISCYRWLRNSGPWVKSCTATAGPVSPPSYITEVGCY